MASETEVHDAAGHSTEQLLRELEDERCRAISDADVVRLRELVDSESTHTHANGTLQDLDTWLLTLGGRPRKATRDNLDVRVYGDTAVLTGVLRNEFTGPDARPAQRMRTLQIWVRRDGSWRQVAFAASGPLAD